MLEWFAMLSCRGSSQPRDQTHVSYVSCLPLVPPGKPQNRNGCPSNIVMEKLYKEGGRQDGSLDPDGSQSLGAPSKHMVKEERMALAA